MNLMEVQNLTYYQDNDKRKILQEISFSLPRGGFLAIMGPSGSGKTTLALALKGILAPNHSSGLTGKIFLAGKGLKDYSTVQLTLKIGLLFQDPGSQLFSPTVEDELAFAPENLCLPPAEIEKRIELTLKKIGMEEYRYCSPQHLSGGQKQLVALGALLTLEPEILIFDEPTAFLDNQEKKRTLELIRTLHQEGKTIILIEHDWQAVKEAERIIILEEGRIVREGSSEEILLDLDFLASHGLPQPPITVLFESLSLPLDNTLDWQVGYCQLEGVLKNGLAGA